MLHIAMNCTIYATQDMEVALWQLQYEFLKAWFEKQS